MRLEGFLKSFAVAVGLTTGMAGRAATAPVVTVAGGAVRGSEAQDVRAWLGIPYAAQPVGPLRWQPPQPVPGWTGERDATRFGPACPQPDDVVYHSTPELQDEACLYLNVWAPARAAGPLPVMVWLHGGAHRIGAGSLGTYDGSRLAARGVVVVTLNYRLGFLGYFAHPALAAEGKAGNFGLMDQIAALRWVHDNIAALGGDPARITIFGQSAGGADVLWLMTSPAARDLFQGAIAQSAGGWIRPLPRADMQQKVLDGLGTIGVKSDADAKALRALDARQLVQASAGDHGLGFGPFADEVTVFEAPWKAFAEGREAKVPMIIGSNDWEGNLVKFRPPSAQDQRTAGSSLVSGWYADRTKDADERRQLLFRDAVFAAPARWLAAQHRRQAPSWLYNFSYVTLSRRSQVPGAGHAAELVYVFDTLDALRAYGLSVDDEDRKVASLMADCWTAFAKAGEPRCAVPWKSYGPEADNALYVGRHVHEARVTDAGVLDGVTKLFGPGGTEAGP